MHNFFEAKRRKLEAIETESGGGRAPPYQLLGGLGVSAIAKVTIAM